jgi:hypothetical protein
VGQMKSLLPAVSSLILLNTTANPQPFSWVQPAIGIMQIIVGFLQAAILWELTYHIFRRSSEQKIAEREAAWFHKVVVDPQIEELRQLFGELASDIAAAAKQCLQGKDAGNDLASFDGIATEAIGNFNARMLPVRRGLMEAVQGFDQQVATKLGARFLVLQDGVTAWFEELRTTKDDSVIEDRMRPILSGCHNDVLTALRQFEFDRWGLPHTRSRFRTLLDRVKQAIEEMQGQSVEH